MQSAFDSALYDWNDFSNDFFSIEPALCTVRFFQEGSVPRQAFQHSSQPNEEVVHHFDSEKIIALMDNGGSMVANRFDKSSKHVADLCRSVSEFLGYATVGNAYATKGGGGTFGMHFDAHCVFALQLIGSKHWTVYRPTVKNPISAHKEVILDTPSASEVVFDGVLDAGDVLYVPRGWWHRVNPIPGKPSLHIATGVHTPKMHDYIKWVLANKMPRLEAFRQSMVLSDVEDNDIATLCNLLARECITKQTFREYMNVVKSSIGEKQFVDFNGIFN